MRTPSPGRPDRPRPTRSRSRPEATLASVVVGLLAITLTACGSDDGTGETADDPSAPATSATASPSGSPTLESAPAPTITESVPPSIEPSGGIGGEPTGKVSEQEQQLLADFAAFAVDPTAQGAAALPLADDVRLGLGPRLLDDVDRDDAGEASEWEIDDVEAWRGYLPPFSALAVIAKDLGDQPGTDDFASVLTFGAGSHKHCASAPQPEPKAVRGMRHLWIQPAKTDSCLDWFTVDLYLTQGRIAAVTTDLYEP